MAKKTSQPARRPSDLRRVQSLTRQPGTALTGTDGGTLGSMSGTTFEPITPARPIATPRRVVCRYRTPGLAQRRCCARHLGPTTRRNRRRDPRRAQPHFEPRTGIQLYPRRPTHRLYPDVTHDRGDHRSLLRPTLIHI